MYTYLIILYINTIVATPRYENIEYKYGSNQQNVSPLVPTTSTINGQPTRSNPKATDAIPTSVTQTLTQSFLNQETPCTSSATTILNIPSTNYTFHSSNPQPTTSTSISTSTSLTDNYLQENSSSSINDQQSTFTPENYKITDNTSESIMENINQKTSSTSYSGSPVQTTPPNSPLININSQSELTNTASTVSANSAPTPAVGSITPNSGLYNDSDNELDYLQQQVHNSNNSIDSSNQIDNDDDDEVVLTTNSGIVYGYGYDNTPYE